MKERLTAYHEAGHAAVARRLGVAVRSVTVVPDDEASGRTWHSGPGSWFRPDIEVDGRTRNRIEAHIMIALAGGEAEDAFLGERSGDGLGPDNDNAVGLALYMSGDSEEASAYLEWLRLRTRNMLRQELVRCEVEAIAAALLDRKRVRAAEVKAICTEAFQALMAERRAGRCHDVVTEPVTG